MSEIRIEKGIGFPVHKLKGAVFERARKGSGIYCYITTVTGSKHAFSAKAARRLSGRGGSEPARFAAWLKKEQDES